VSANFGTDRLGDIRNHSFFVVSVVNVGQRAVTIREIEWEGAAMSFALHVFRTSKGTDLPVKVEADDELRILFDPGNAAQAIARTGHRATAINVVGSGRARRWKIGVTDAMRDEADDEMETIRLQGE